jgi:LacI family transcriptional regulator
MAQLPHRISLHDQLVALLREGILASRWNDELPSEAELCREFHVSRMTLRKALAQLAVERWITLGGRGRFHGIYRKPLKREIATARTIRVLTPFSSAGVGSIDHVLFETLSERVTKTGFRLEIEHHPQLFKSFQASKLARLDALPDTAAWVLFYATEPIQRWFASRRRPTVVAGRVHDSLPLSNIYPDTLAAARHAAGLLCSRGHGDLVYLIANLTSLGDRLASEVFVAEAQRLGARARVVNYDAGDPSVGKAMMDMLASRPRPTGYVTGASEVAITVLCHLQSAGVRVPANASVIALWDDFILDCTYPVIARYHTDGRAFGRHIGRTLLDLIRHGTGKVRSIPIIPEFVAGGSVGSGK